MSLLRPDLYQGIKVPRIMNYPTTTKSTIVNYPFNVATGSTEGVILFSPHNPRNRISIYHYRTPSPANVYTPPGYYWAEDIYESDNVWESFTQLALVSGAISLQCMTVASGAFAVQGSMSGVSFHEMPALSSFNYANLASLRQRANALKVGVSVMEGLVVRATPLEEVDFLTYDAPVGINEDEVLTTMNFVRVSSTVDDYPKRLIARIRDTAQPVANFNRITNISNDAIYTIYPEQYFPNYRGHYRLNVSLTGTGSAASDADFVVRVTSAYALPGTTNITTRVQSLRLASGVAVGTAAKGATASVEWDCALPIHRLEVVYVPVVGTVSFTTTDFNFEIVAISYDRPGYINDGSIIAWTGLSAGQQFSLTGVMNYDAVPNAQLMKNLQTSYVSCGNTRDLELAMHGFSALESMGYGNVMTLEEYYNENSHVTYQNYTRRENLEASASIADAVINAGKWAYREIGPRAARVARAGLKQWGDVSKMLNAMKKQAKLEIHRATASTGSSGTYLSGVRRANEKQEIRELMAAVKEMARYSISASNSSREGDSVDLLSESGYSSHTEPIEYEEVKQDGSDMEHFVDAVDTSAPGSYVNDTYNLDAGEDSDPEDGSYVAHASSARDAAYERMTRTFRKTVSEDKVAEPASSRAPLSDWDQLLQGQLKSYLDPDKESKIAATNGNVACPLAPGKSCHQQFPAIYGAGGSKTMLGTISVFADEAPTRHSASHHGRGNEVKYIEYDKDSFERNIGPFLTGSDNLKIFVDTEIAEALHFIVGYAPIHPNVQRLYVQLNCPIELSNTSISHGMALFFACVNYLSWNIFSGGMRAPASEFLLPSLVAAGDLSRKIYAPDKFHAYRRIFFAIGAETSSEDITAAITAITEKKQTTNNYVTMAQGQVNPGRFNMAAVASTIGPCNASYNFVENIEQVKLYQVVYKESVFKKYGETNSEAVDTTSEQVRSMKGTISKAVNTVGRNFRIGELPELTRTSVRLLTERGLIVKQSAQRAEADANEAAESFSEHLNLTMSELCDQYGSVGYLSYFLQPCSVIILAGKEHDAPRSGTGGLGGDTTTVPFVIVGNEQVQVPISAVLDIVERHGFNRLSYANSTNKYTQLIKGLASTGWKSISSSSAQTLVNALMDAVPNDSIEAARKDLKDYATYEIGGKSRPTPAAPQMRKAKEAKSFFTPSSSSGSGLFSNQVRVERKAAVPPPPPPKSQPKFKPPQPQQKVAQPKSDDDYLEF